MKTRLPGAVWALTILLVLTPLAASAYQIGEDTPPDTGAAQNGNDGAGPIRLARFSYVQGNVTWRAGDDAAWSPASVNLPIRQGAQIWVTNGGRAEVQFDDGSLLRLGNGAVSTLQTLYSDENGEFTEIQMNEGLSELALRGSHSIYQVDTPLVSIKSEGPSKVRIGVDNSVEIAVRDGQATVEGDGAKTTLGNGDYLDLSDANSSYDVGPLPDPDSWDRFNDDRDQELADADSNLPASIALVAGNLDTYGEWHFDPRYGQVWCPNVADAGWRPYQHGHWVWVDPFGWTWVSSEAWGWAPYHYGTWVSEPYGWGWVPGPARQYWCPAVVHFSEYQGGVAWAPLAPAEVRYPPVLSIGFHGGNWSAFFSIGGAAVYYPQNASYCAPRPFSNVTVNRTTYVNNVMVNNVTINRNSYLSSTVFVPINARNASGVTTASVAEFGEAGRYHPQAQGGGAGFFARGRSIGAPVGGAAPVAGPLAVRPTALAFTSTRSFLPGVHPSAFVVQRPVFRAALPQRVAPFAPALPFQARVNPEKRFDGGVRRSTPFSPSRVNTNEAVRRQFDPDQAPQNPPPMRFNRVPASQPQPFRGADSAPQQNNPPRPFDQPRPFNQPKPFNQPRPAAPAPAVPSTLRGYHYREESPLDSRPLTPRPEARPQNRPVPPPAKRGQPNNAKPNAPQNAPDDEGRH